MQIRKAKIQDTPKIVQLINHFAKEGIMLPKPLSKIYEYIRDFSVVEKDGEVVGCGALHIYWENLAEVRSLAIAPEHQRSGFGKILVEKLLNEARDFDINTVFALSFKPEFFKKLGFEVVDKETLPHKIWKDCMECPHFPDCDEVALKLKMNGVSK